MSLERTNFGLSNEHLFYDVEIVIYCEGKESGGSTHDEMFWSKIFYNHGVKCVCKSRGSKTNIVPLAQRAIEGDVKNIAFAMDRDYGDYHGLPIEDPRVIYTYGYSWENDVILDMNAARAFSLFAPVVDENSVDRDFISFTAAVADSAMRVTLMDIRVAPTAMALFDREKPVSIFVGAGDDLRFNEALIENKFRQIVASATVADVQELEPDWMRIFYGKACSRLIYQWFVDRSQAYSNRSKVPYDVFLRMGISMMNISRELSPRNRYYSEAVANFA